MSRVPLRQQRGVALLVVLILLVMMSALAAKISQQFCRNLQKTHYQVSQQQLRWAIQRQEQVVKMRLQTAAIGENSVLTLEGEWHEPLETQGEYYTVLSQVEDAEDCFNVNNLLTEEKAAQGQEPSAIPENRVNSAPSSNCWLTAVWITPRRNRSMTSWWITLMATAPR